MYTCYCIKIYTFLLMRVRSFSRPRVNVFLLRKQLRREPFVVCISSIAQQVEVDEGGGNFQVAPGFPIHISELMFIDSHASCIHTVYTIP